MRVVGGIILILTGILELSFGIRIIMAGRALLISDSGGTIIIAFVIAGMVFAIAALTGGLYAAAGKRFTFALICGSLAVVGALFIFWPLVFGAMAAAVFIIVDRKTFAA